MSYNVLCSLLLKLVVSFLSRLAKYSCVATEQQYNTCTIVILCSYFMLLVACSSSASPKILLYFSCFSLSSNHYAHPFFSLVDMYFFSYPNIVLFIFGLTIHLSRTSSPTSGLRRQGIFFLLISPFTKLLVTKVYCLVCCTTCRALQ